MSVEGFSLSCQEETFVVEIEAKKGAFQIKTEEEKDEEKAKGETCSAGSNRSTGTGENHRSTSAPSSTDFERNSTENVRRRGNRSSDRHDRFGFTLWSKRSKSNKKIRIRIELRWGASVSLLSRTWSLPLQRQCHPVSLAARKRRRRSRTSSLSSRSNAWLDNGNTFKTLLGID